jgi:hypothetical protein
LEEDKYPILAKENAIFRGVVVRKSEFPKTALWHHRVDG